MCHRLNCFNAPLLNFRNKASLFYVHYPNIFSDDKFQLTFIGNLENIPFGNKIFYL